MGDFDGFVEEVDMFVARDGGRAVGEERVG